AYGNAVHKTLQKAHNHLIATGKRLPISKILQDFEYFLKQQRLDEQDFERNLGRGQKNLTKFFDKKYTDFLPNQKTELDFKNQQVILDDAELTGRVDLVTIDVKQRTISVTDYKTGKPPLSWTGKDDY